MLHNTSQKLKKNNNINLQKNQCTKQHLRQNFVQGAHVFGWNFNNTLHNISEIGGKAAREGYDL